METMSPNDQNTHLNDNEGSFLTISSSQTSHLHSHSATKQFYFTATFLATQWKLLQSKLYFNLVGSGFQLRRKGALSLHHVDEFVSRVREIPLRNHVAAYGFIESVPSITTSVILERMPA
jgi:hypothetical protein